MRLLIDTNVLIALEPVTLGDREQGLVNAAELNRLASAQGHQLCVHPETAADLARDRDATRAEIRSELLGKYVALNSPPPITAHLENVVGRVAIGSHDWADHALLAAVLGDAVDFLVTEDRGIHAKARRLELENRVLTINEAVSTLRDLYDTTPETPPLVRAIECHQLDSSDPIWSSFREEYDKFDVWFAGCKRKGRPAWVVEVGNRYAGIAIVKTDQDPTEYGLAGKSMKLCSLKVCDDFNGNRYGELLLRAVFDYAFENSFENIVVTVFPNHWLLIGLLEAFGFNEHSTNSVGEQVRLKRLAPSQAETDELDGLEFHIQFGPQAAKLVSGQTFIVPIMPRYHRQLFPELEMAALDGCRPCGNSMRKAYLSHSGIRGILPGAVLLFYRSEDWRAVDVIGVVEDTLRSTEPVDIARFVGKSTVFDYQSIERFCEQGETLALRFRQVVTLKSSDRLNYRALIANGVIRDAPQTVQSIAGGETWLTAKIQRLY